MEKREWKAVTPTDAELKVLMRATPRRPEALNAWLLAHEPPPAPIPAPAAPVVKTAASEPAAKGAN